MNKTAFVWMWVVIVFALVVAAGAVAWALGIFSPSYYAIYMTTGDLYFGKLMPFSHTLTDVWYLQRDAQSQSLNLSEFSKSVWGPLGSIVLNEQNIVWKARLSAESPVTAVLQGIAPTQTQKIPTYQQQVPPASSEQNQNNTQKISE